MKSIQVKGDVGRIVFFPSSIPKKLIDEIEDQLKQLILDTEDYMGADEVRAILKQKDPLIGTIGGALRGYRAREGLTQQQLARKSGIKQSHLSEMERNKRPIGVKVAKKLAKVLKCNYKRFL